MQRNWRFGSRAWPLLSLAVAAVTIPGCAADAQPRVTVSAQDWLCDGVAGRRLSTKHFEVFSTIRDREFEVALPAFMEALHQRYQATLPAAAEADRKLTVYVFGTRSEWARFTSRHYPARYRIYCRIRSGGFTEGDTSVSFYVDRSLTLATLAHEGWHQYAGSRFDATLPAWLDEGMACTHEAVRFSGDRSVFTPRGNVFRINNLREAIQKDTLLSLREIVDTDAGQVINSVHARRAQTYYAQAWALVTFLRYGAGGRVADAFDQLLDDVTNGTFDANVSAAKLTAADGTSLTDGAAAFQAYFDRSPEDLADDYYNHLIRISGF